MEKMKVISAINGSITYSILTEPGRKIIYEKLKMDDLIRMIVNKYPESAKKISNYFRSGVSVDLPPELDILNLQPSERENLSREIWKLQSIKDESLM